MANPFDKFDAPAGGNPFDAFDGPATTPAAPIDSRQAEVDAYDAQGGGFMTGLERGLRRAEQSAAGAVAAIGEYLPYSPIGLALDAAGKDREAIGQDIMAQEQAIRELPMHPTTVRMAQAADEASGEGSIWDSIKRGEMGEALAPFAAAGREFMESPDKLGFAVDMTAEQIPVFAEFALGSKGMGAVLPKAMPALARTSAQMAGAGGLSSVAATYGPNVAEGLGRGLSYDDAEARALKQSAAQAVIDGATGAVLPFKIGPGQYTNIPAQALIQAAGGGGGEIARQGVVGEEASSGEVVMESLLELLGLPVEAVQAAAAMRSNKPSPQPEPVPAPRADDVVAQATRPGMSIADAINQAVGVREPADSGQRQADVEAAVSEPAGVRVPGPEGERELSMGEFMAMQAGERAQPDAAPVHTMPDGTTMTGPEHAGAVPGSERPAAMDIERPVQPQAPSVNAEQAPNMNDRRKADTPVEADRRTGRDRRQAFRGPYDMAVEEHFKKAREHNLSEEQAKAFAPQDTRDAVTGFHRAEDREPTLKRAQEHIEQTGQPGTYIEADIQNLNGMNAAIGHAGADEVYRGITDIFEEELGTIGADYVPVRHGGDEFSAIIVGAAPDAVKPALARAKSRVREYIKEQGLSDIPHTKEEAIKAGITGVGVNFGTSEIIPGAPAKAIFSAADKQVEAKKLEVENNVNGGTPEAPRSAAPEGQTGGAEKGPTGDAGPTGEVQDQAQQRDQAGRGEGEKGTVSSSGQNERPQLPAEYSVGPSSAKTNKIDKVTYRETDAEGVDKVFWGAYANAPGDAIKLYVADNPDLAIGQGANKGVLIQFRQGALSGGVNKKPFMTDSTGKEYVTDYVARDPIDQLLAPKETKFRSVTRQALRRYFDNRDLGDKVLYTRKGVEIDTPLSDVERITDSSQGKEKVADFQRKLYSNPLDPELIGQLFKDLAKPAGWTQEQWNKATARWREDLEITRDNMKGAFGHRPPWQQVGHVARVIGYSNDGMLEWLERHYDSPTIGKIRRMLWAPAGESDRATGVTWQDAVNRHTMANLNKMAKLLEPVGRKEADLQQVARLMQNPDQIRPGTPIHDAAKGLSDMLQGELKYQREAGVDVGEVKGYFPRMPDGIKIADNQGAFLKAAQRAYQATYPELKADEAKEMAERWMRKILQADIGVQTQGNDFVSIHGSTPVPDHAKKRVFNKEAEAILQPYMQTNPTDALSTYFIRSARRAEWERRFGGDKWKVLRQQMEEEGAWGAIDTVVKAIQSATGNTPGNFSGDTSSLLSWLRTWTALTFLPRATFSSISEIAMTAVRTGDARTLARNVATTFRELKKSHKNDELRQISEEVLGLTGKVANDMLMQQRFGGQVDRKMAQYVTNRFFYMTGLHQWTEATRIAALDIGQWYVGRLAKDVAGNTSRKKSSQMALTELGIADPEAFAKALDAAGGKLDAKRMKARDQFAEDYATALQRFVDQTIMNPKAVERPRFANTPMGSLAYALLSFIYSFHKNVLTRSVKLAGQAATGKGLTAADRLALATPALMLTLPVLVQLGLGELRDEILFKDPNRKVQERTVTDKVITALSRAGIFGAFDPLINFYTSLKYERDPATVAMGPLMGTVSEMFKAFVVLNERNSENTDTAERNFGKHFYNLFVAPSLNAIATLAPSPVAGAFGIQASSHPATRAAFMDLFGDAEDSGRSSGRTSSRSSSRTSSRSSSR